MLDVFNKDYLKDVKFFGEKTEIQKIQNDYVRMMTSKMQDGYKVWKQI